MAIFVLYAFATIIVSGMLGTIYRVGKPVKPTTSGTAAAVAFMGMVELVALAYLSTQV